MARETLEVKDGVQASADARTPSAVLEALEFRRVLDQVASHAAGPLGAARVRARRPATSLGWISLELTRVEELARLGRAGKGVVAEPVSDVSEALGRLRVDGSVLDGAELVVLRRTLTAARLVAGELRRVRDDAPRSAELERPVPDRALERRLELSLEADGSLLDTASPGLAAARSDVRQARDRLIQRLEAMLRAVGGEGTVTVRNGRYVIPVPRDLRGRPDGIVHGESASGATLFIEPSQAIPLGNAMREAEARADREALKVLRDLTNLLRPEAVALGSAQEMCLEVDDLAARAAWAVGVEGNRPRMVAAPGELRLVRARHPLLLVRERPAEPVVPFDLALEPEERTIILSGPNTGGKSVLLKAVGLAVLLAQSGIIPPVGEGTILPVFDRVFADIGDRQSIAQSLSTFSAHLVELREVLETAGGDTLVLLDEIGSGTDPAEGAALASAALLSLTRRAATTIATTHLGALKQLAARAGGIVNASLQFDAATLRPTYRFVKGVPGRSYGLAIARRLGLPEEVLREAEAEIPDAERHLDALLAAVERREREQGELEARLAAEQARLARETARVAEEAEASARRATEVARRERVLERAGRDGGRKYLLEARQRVEEALALARAARTEEEARQARRLLEEAAEAEGRTVAELDRREAPPPGGPAGPLAVGMRVRLDSGSKGEVLELRSEREAVVAIGSMKLVLDPASLVVLPDQPGRRAAESHGPRGADWTQGAPGEIDLRGLSGDEAEQTVLAAIDAAVVSEQSHLRIIHGKGTGVVRERVQQVIRRDRRVRHHGFAPPNQGGTGVTLVELA
jgi:DNA mismatch repair protein MutS2